MGRGDATGFMQFEYDLSGKWLELLKQIAPNVARAAVLRDPARPSGIGQFAVIQSVAPSVGVEVRPVSVRDAAEIERAVAAFARSPNSGLIVTSSALTARHRELIIALAARHKLPAVYYRRYFVTTGGLFPDVQRGGQPGLAHGRPISVQTRCEAPRLLTSIAALALPTTI